MSLFYFGYFLKNPPLFLRISKKNATFALDLEGNLWLLEKFPSLYF